MNDDTSDQKVNINIPSTEGGGGRNNSTTKKHSNNSRKLHIPQQSNDSYMSNASNSANDSNDNNLDNSDNSDTTPEQQGHGERRHFFSDDLASQNDGAWIKCLPEWFSLAFATILFAVLGLIIGAVISLETNASDWVLEVIYYPGKLWVRGLKLLILPLIVSLMIIIPSSLSAEIKRSKSTSSEDNSNGGTASVGNMGLLAMKFYIFTSFMAACEGTIWGNIIRPGTHANVSDFADFEGSTTETTITWWESILTIGENAIPENIIEAMASLNILGIIVVFLAFGILIKRINESSYNNKYDKYYHSGANLIIELCKTVLRCLMIGIGYFIWFTPIGMFSLVMYKCASTNDLLNLLQALGWYVITSVIGQFVHMFVFYPLLYLFITGNNGWLHWWRVKQAAMVAFATSSSAATLSVSLNVARVSGNVSNDVVNFVIPLGATVNMDGTGCGFPIMVLFIAQLYGIDLNFGSQLSVLILAVVCSVGSAPIPSAGMYYDIILLFYYFIISFFTSVHFVLCHFLFVQD